MGNLAGARSSVHRIRGLVFVVARVLEEALDLQFLLRFLSTSPDQLTLAKGSP
jgi:hypothetical protein